MSDAQVIFLGVDQAVEDAGDALPVLANGFFTNVTVYPNV
jgi:hypothetical protein